MSDTSSYPTEIIQLPSQGMFYGDTIPGGKVELRPMTTAEERILAGSKGSNSLNIFDKLISRCMVSPKINPDQLLITDRFFLFMVIRVITYGPHYGFNIKCPNCSLNFKHQVNILTDLKITSLDEEAKEPLEVKLPKSGKTVKLRLLRGFDEKAIQDYENSQLRNNLIEGDPAYVFRMARHVVQVDQEEMSFMQVLGFLENLHGADSSTIKDALDKYDSGIDPTVNTNCPKCSTEVALSLPLNAEFFRVRL